MMGNSIGKTLFIFSVTVALIAFGCAKISSPSGGPRDRQPPVVVGCTPPDGSINFSAKEIAITFDEYVVLDKISEKFMVSPPMQKRPDILIRGKDIRIRFSEKLRDSTTYTFYFQDAIRDLNENNPIDNFQFVLSTGPVIDSLSVTGNVLTSYNLEVPENTLVLLYGNMADSSVRKQLPDYITRVRKNSEFRIDNIKPGKYRLYALTDVDNSKNYNFSDEAFAFLDDTVIIDPENNYLPVRKDTGSLNIIAERKDVTPGKPGASTPKIEPPAEGQYRLIMFQAEKTDRYLTSSGRKLPYLLVYTLSLPPDTLGFSFSVVDPPTSSYFLETNANKDTVTVWLTDSAIYSQPLITTIFEYPFTDTLGMNVPRKDTIMMRYIAPKSARARPLARNEYRVATSTKSGQLKPDQQIVFISPTPFRQPDTTAMKFFEISKEERLRVPFNLRNDSLNSCRLIMDAELEQGKNYLLIADSAAFGSIYGEYNDSTGMKFSVMSPESLGLLKMNISNNTGNIIVQLLNNNENLVKEQLFKGEGIVEFPYLDKGFYRARVIYDLNCDGKWTTGDFNTHRQPEPVSYYPAEIEIKENWEITQDWDIGAINTKDFKLTSASKGKK